MRSRILVVMLVAVMVPLAACSPAEEAPVAFTGPLASCTPAEQAAIDQASAEARVETMNPPEWVTDLFRAVDSMDADTFVEFMAEDVSFRNGSAEALQGRAAVHDDIGALFSSIKGINHVLSDTWVLGDTIVVHGTVTYTRLDETALTVPFADIWKMDQDLDLIQEYLIFVDNTNL